MKDGFPALSETIEGRLQDMSSPYIRPGLSRIAALLSKMGHPERAFPAVHLVGTNGKGSVSAMIESLFLEAGYSTCLYTSPHLTDITERLRFSGVPVDRGVLLRSLDRVESALGGQGDSGSRPTYFEVLTAAAFDAIADRSPDVAIIEAGMGGRLDATNMVKDVALTVITAIGFDHSQFLGGTLEEIANEKFSVLRPGGRSVFSGTPKTLQGLFLERCKGIGNTGEILSRSVEIRGLKVSLEGNHFEISLRSGEYLPVKTALGGTYQVENAALALLSAQALSFRYPRMDLKTAAGGLERTRWRGRLEKIRYGDCELVLDGAHNPQGVHALADTFEALGMACEYAVIFTAMKDKALEDMVARICGSFPMVAFTRVPDMERSAEPDFLLDMSRPYAKKCVTLSFEDPMSALEEVSRRYKKIIICGSLYLLGYMMTRLSLKAEGESR
ncbi:MAG TPA: Mur ligase family protein [Synergistales bacterium]|nr:Mur ligase family protein [Synergistales bacterium]